MLVCRHALLRARNGGLCPLCHTQLNAYGLTKEQLYQAVLAERSARTASACKAHLATFFRESWAVLEPGTPFIDSWHFDVLGAHMEAVFFGWLARKRGRIPACDFQNLLANVPPGTAKSRFLSVCFMPWAWLYDPTFSGLSLSLNPNVARRDADLMRYLVESEWYRKQFAPQWVLRDDRHAVGYFQIEATNGSPLGWRRSFGIEASVIGERAWCVTLDDPHDPRDLDPDQLQRVIKIWDKSIYNRVNNPAMSIRICIMQRVDKHDMAGHMLAKKEQRWLPLVIPMTRQETHTNNELGWTDPRAVGERLMPEINTDEVINVEKARLGPELASAVLDQAPLEYGSSTFTPSEFRWFRFDTDLESSPLSRPTGSSLDEAQVLSAQYNGRYFDSMVISVDGNSAKSNAEATGSDVGVQVWGFLGHNMFLVEDATEALGFNETIDNIRALLARWPEVTKLWVEAKALGPALLAQLSNDVAELEGIPVDKSKRARATAATSAVRAGRVWFRDGQPWNAKTCEQVYKFPSMRKNDRVDAMTQVINHHRQVDYFDRLTALATL